eukprot:scaffold1643_cov123-Skeletonema_marinoi.AAC.6
MQEETTCTLAYGIYKLYALVRLHVNLPKCYMVGDVGQAMQAGGKVPCLAHKLVEVQMYEGLEEMQSSQMGRKEEDGNICEMCMRNQKIKTRKINITVSLFPNALECKAWLGIGMKMR